MTLQLPGLEVLEELGEGARNLVYRARLRGRLVAVKVPRRRRDLDRVYKEYLCEASLLGRVSHPGLVEVYEVGLHHDLPYLVQELAEGQPLSEVLKRGPYSPEATLELARQLAATLAAVHERGLIHRDVKPANILIGSTRARLIDFGLTTRRPTSGPIQVATGTFSYSAPEQTGMLSRPLDGRADLYALGVVLYECVSGELPFRSEDPGEMMHLHATRKAPDPPSHLPPVLREAIVRLMAKDPDDRFASARKFYHFLGNDPPLGPPRRPSLVGRRAQSETLERQWLSARQDRGSLLVVSGPAGTGKTALIRDFLSRQRDYPALRARCLPDDAPYGALKRLLEQLVEKLPAEWVADLKAAAGRHLPLVADFSPALGRLFGLPQGVHEEDPAHHLLALSHFLIQAASSRPIVVVVEDLHWADASSMRVLLAVSELWQRTHSLLILSGRPEAIADFAWPQISLENLSEAGLQQFLEETLGDCTDSRLFEQLHMASSGNPMTALATLESALDAGRLVPHWGRWRMEGSGLELPGDAIDAILAGIEQLDERSLRLLQRAAVFGVQFQAHYLELHETAVHSLLDEARRLRLIERLEGDHYRFLHDRIRDRFLETLDPQRLRQLHLDSAQALGADQPFSHAHHLWQSFPCPSPEVCCQAQRRAALLAIRQHAYSEAYQLFGRLESAQAQQDADCAEAYGYACFQMGHFGQALTQLRAALPLCTSDLARARVYQRLALVYMVEIDTEKAWPEIVQGLAAIGIPLSNSGWNRSFKIARDFLGVLASRLGNSQDARLRSAVRLLDIGIQVCFIGGKIPQLLELVVRGLRIARQLGPSAPLAAFYANAGVLLSAAGLSGPARQLREVALQMAEQAGDAAALGRCQILSSVTLRLSGDDCAAAQQVDRCLLQHGAWLPTLDYLFGVLELTHNYHFRGLVHKAYECALLGEQRVRQDHFPLTVTSNLAPVYAAVGRHGEARRYRELNRQYADRNSNPLVRAAFFLSSLHAEMERGELGPEVDRLIELNKQTGLNPDTGPIPLRSFRILEAYVRYRQAMTDRSRLPELKMALRQLRIHRRNSMFDTHYRVLEAGYHRLAGHAERARNLLARAENQAHAKQNYWVMIEVAKQRAYLLRDQELFEAANLQARAAAAMASELGWVAQLHRIETEFALNQRSQSPSDRESGSQSALTLRLQRHLKALLEVTQATAQVLDVPRISDLVLVEVMRILAAERAFLFLIEGEELRFQCGRDSSGLVVSLPPNYASSLVEQVRLKGRATLLSADEEGQISPSASIQSHDLRSVLAAPLLWRDRLVGVVYLDNRLSKGAFSSDDVDVLQALANQVAVSLETARAARLELEVRGERHQRLLAEQLSEMVGSLLTHLDDSEILARLLDGLKQIVDFGQAEAFLLKELSSGWEEVLQSNRPILREEDHWMGTALPSASGPLGVLTLKRDQPFNRAEIELVHTLASYAGVALENSQLFASVQRMATIDELTGILNRRQFLKEAQDELQRADRLGHAVSLVMFDVDHFKKFNDTHGHAIGDLVLRTVSSRCKECLRGIDHLGRLGGEEFAVLLVGTGLEPGCATADRLRRSICDQAFPSTQGDLSVSISLGVAQRQPQESLDHLLERADVALYAAKRGGRNRVESG